MLGDIAGAVGSIVRKIADVILLVAKTLADALKAGFIYFSGLLKLFMSKFTDYMSSNALQLMKILSSNPEGAISYIVFVRGVLQGVGV